MPRGNAATPCIACCHTALGVARCCTLVGEAGGRRSPHCSLANLGGASGPPRSKIGGGASDPPSNRNLWGASDPQAKLLRGLLLSLVRLVFDLLLETTHLLSKSHQARQTGQLTSLSVAQLPSCIVSVPCRKKSTEMVLAGIPRASLFSGPARNNSPVVLATPSTTN